VPEHRPEIRLADFCNLHFKDEHPSCVWIPEGKPLPKSLAIHVTQLASSDLSSRLVRLLAATGSGEHRDSDTPVVEQ
jgi:hypothetical protein